MALLATVCMCCAAACIAGVSRDDLLLCILCPALQSAYLALAQLMDYNNELVLLLVNTLLSDLKSDNFVTGNAELHAAGA
jgi:hypothetical protein